MAGVQAALAALAEEYSTRGIEIKETAAGFRIQVRADFSNEISRLWPERPAKYSRALLETLAIIAYRQPITRAEIEAVRGVAVNPNIVKTVIERNWVHVVGHRDVPGRPELLATTRDFLDYFGLKRLDELPPLAEIKAIGEIKMQFDLPDPGPLALASAAVDAAGEATAGEVADAAAGSVEATAGEVADAAAGSVEATAGEAADTAAGTAVEPAATGGEAATVEAANGAAANTEAAITEASDAATGEAANAAASNTHAADVDVASAHTANADTAGAATAASDDADATTAHAPFAVTGENAVSADELTAETASAGATGAARATAGEASAETRAAADAPATNV
jgi:segregation and condensation protein B